MNIAKTTQPRTKDHLLPGFCHCLLLFLILPIAAQAQFTCVTNNGTITITGYTGPAGDVIIPETIDGLPVTRIGDNAFEGRTDLTSVVLPNSVTSIGVRAFATCFILTGIVLPDNVTSIGNSAFMECSGLTNVVIGSSVTTIGDYAFDNCRSLTSITIPNSVTRIVNLRAKPARELRVRIGHF